MCTSNSGSNDVSVFFGEGDGTFSVQPGFRSGGKDPIALVTADVVGDLNLDLLIANEASNMISILSGRENGQFGPEEQSGGIVPENSICIPEEHLLCIPLNESGFPTALIAGDVNETDNGKLEFVVATKLGGGGVGGDIVILSRDGINSIPPEAKIVDRLDDVPTALALGDVDSDGKKDIIAVRESVADASIFRQVDNENLDFELLPSTIRVGVEPSALALAHLNDDPSPNDNTPDFLDLVVTNRDSVLIQLGTGTSILNGARDNFVVGVRPSAVTLRDLNRDGNADVITASQGFGRIPGLVSILLGDGNAGFPEQLFLVAGSGSSSVVLRDLTVNGLLDIIVTNEDSNDVTVLLAQGDKVYSRQTIPVGGGPVAVVTGDFNDDGFLDVVTANKRTDNISVLLSTEALKNIPVDPKQKLVTLPGGETFLALVLTIPEDQIIPQGRDMLFSVRAFSSNSRDPMFGGDKKIEFFDPDADQRIVIENFSPIPVR